MDRSMDRSIDGWMDGYFIIIVKWWTFLSSLRKWDVQLPVCAQLEQMHAQERHTPACAIE